MKMIRQQNVWSCTIAALAMLANRTFEQVVADIGHDGSEIWWPNDRKPWRSISTQEIIETAFFKYNIALVEFVGAPAGEDSKGENLIPIYNDSDARIKRLMLGHPGLIVGAYSVGQLHMVAWDGINVYDPNDGRIYEFWSDEEFERITIDYFLRAVFL